MISFAHAFGFSSEPFAQEVPLDKLFPLPGLDALLQRFDYALHTHLVTVITGEVGSGKSTSLRYAQSRLHPSQYRILSLIATTGTMLELLRQICLELGAPATLFSAARLFKTVRDALQDIRATKQIPVLLIDEAHLMRLDVFAQLHTLTQFHFDSASLMPIVLSGQLSLIDRLLYHTSRPFASRIVGRSHLEALQLDHMRHYLAHHLSIAGGKPSLLSEEAVLAIHQSSGGLLRRANNLARGALLAAALEQCPTVSAEHVRIASTEIL
jgi:type II secretory pathway predicted ATPase ExeA